jgi:hypothetical protein
MDNIEQVLKNLSKEERDKFIAEAKMTSKQIDRSEKTTEKQEESLKQIYDSFCNALKIYEQPTRGERKSTGMCFYRDKQPTYFYTFDSHVLNPITGKIEWTTELKYISPSSLYPNFAELKTERSRDFLRRMVEGDTISITNPETQTAEEYQFQRRVYDRLTNTVKEVDKLTFNLLDLSTRLKPNYDKNITQACPIIYQALLASISGNVLAWDADNKTWTGSKQENQDWMERWIYGAVYASIGNNQMPFPVIFGGGRIGKNALFDIIFPKILAPQLCFSGVWDIVNSGFSQFKLGKVVMFIDEAPERTEWSVIKNMTGSPRQYIKVKYGAEFETDNCIVIAVGSNHTNYPFPFEDGPQMRRVSPIHASKFSTFAGNVYKMLEQTHGAGYCQKILKEHNITIDPLDEFAQGDALLRGPLNGDWDSREAAQQFLNYLDQKYHHDASYYFLEPLRGEDWNDICENRKNAIESTVEFVNTHAPDIISINELFEIYKTIQIERHTANSVLHFSNFKTTVKNAMEESGWICRRNNIIRNGTSPELFYKQKPSHGELRDFEESFERYIVSTSIIGSGINLRRLRQLDTDEPVVNTALDRKMQLIRAGK